MLISTLLASGGIVLFVFYLLRMRGKIRGKPLPGPSVLESLQVFLKGAARNTLRFDVTKYADKYGPIMQFRLLILNVIFVNDADTLRRMTVDSLTGKYANDRPPTFLGRYIYNESFVFENNSPKHVYKRKVFHSLLKFYGEGVGKFESLMTETLQDLSEFLRKKPEVEVSSVFRDYISSIIIVLLTGVKSSFTNESINKIKNWPGTADELLLFDNEIFLQNFPFLCHIPGLRFKTLVENASKSREELIDTFIKPSQQKTDNDFGKGIVHELLEDRKKPGSKFEITDADVIGISLDIVSGAYLTTSSTVCSIFLQLAKNLNMQSKIYDEVIKVMGDETPSFNHRKDMHYTEAVILETLRYSSMIPFIPRCMRDDFEFDGYHIPRGSTLLANLWYSNHNASVWGDPWMFRPERFLNEKGEVFEATHPIRQQLLAFGSGPRKCPGESFAKSRLFLIVTTLVKQFEILPILGKEMSSFDPRTWKPMLVMQPDEFSCRFVPRDVQ